MTTTKVKNISNSGASPKRTRRQSKKHPLFDQINSFGIGMDVHKDSIATCISGRLPNEDIVVLKDHSFRNDHRGVQELCKFLKPYASKSQFLMECTGVYHVALYRALQEEFPSKKEHIIAMNPLLVHNRIADLGTKTDRADAHTLSSLAFYDKILRPSYVGSAHFFATRDLMRSYHKNSIQITSLKNRIHRHLHLANQKFPFDLSADWGLSFLDRYVSKSWSLNECYLEYLDELNLQKKGKVLEKRAELIIPNADVKMTESQRFLVQMDLLRLLYAQQTGAVFLKQAESHILSDKGLCKHYEQLQIIPGFSAVTILTVLTEVGDYTRFSNADAFCKFCGVVPTVEQSGEYRSKGHINRFTNKHLRRALSQAAAVVVSRPNQNSDIGVFAYRQFRIRGLPFKKAIMKVAYKYSRILFGMFTEIRAYDPVYETV